AKKLGDVKAKSGGRSIGVISAARLLNEDQYTLRKFAAGALETNNADFYQDDDEVDLPSLFRNGVPTIATQAHVQNADTILLIGTDPDEENPLTAFSIRWAVRQKAARLFIINSVPSRLERQAGLFVRVREGSVKAVIAGLLDESRMKDAGEATGTNTGDLGVIRKVVYESNKGMRIFGEELRGPALEALSLFEDELATPNPDIAETAKKIHIDSLQRQVKSSNSPPKPSINDNPYTYIVERPTLEIGAEAVRSETKFSFLPLVRYANSMGTWQMGLASSLMGGMTARAMLDPDSKLKALYIAGEDVIGKANAGALVVRSALEKLDLLVVSEMFLTDTAKLAHIVFPATSFAESQGTLVNNGSQVQFVRRTIPPVGQARPGWMIANQIAKLMGIDFGYQGQLKNVFKEIAEKVPGFKGLSHNRLANEGAIQINLPRPIDDQIDAADL